MNILGIDFEDWFHPELIQKYISKKDNQPKIVQGIDKILNLLRKKDTNATFFVVGELLEFKPELLDLILDNDHEIGFHTMKHNRIDSPNFKEKFEEEIKRFDKLTDGNSIIFPSSEFPSKNLLEILYGFFSAFGIPYKLVFAGTTLLSYT